MISNFITQYWSEFIFCEIIFTIILFLIIFPLSYILKNKSPYWRYYLWILLFIRLILPTNFSLPVNVWQFADDLNLFHWINLSSEPITLSVFEDDLSVQEEQVILPDNYTSANFQSLFNKVLILKICFAFWLTGFFIALFLFYQKKLWFKKIILNAQLAGDVEIRSISQTWKSIYGINRSIKIYASDKSLSPFTIDIIRPKIFIPRAVLDTNDLTLLNSIIGHEMAHIKRFDVFWTHLQLLIQALFFFYPIIWIAGRQLNLAREGICDQMVLRDNKILPKQYARSIIQILKLNAFGSIDWPYAPAFKGNKQSLKLRINQIMENKIMNKKKLWLLVLSISFFGFTTLPMASIMDNTVQKDQSTYPTSKIKEEDYKLPIKTGKISSGFGQRMHPFKKVLMHHNGVDIKASKGTKVYAVADGIVDFADLDGDWGNKIVLIHQSNYSSLYGQLSEILVEKGMSVKAGQLIGLVGNSGMATAPHLHFEFRENNKPLDPEEVIDFSQLQSDND